MSQEKTQKKFTRQVMSDELQFDGNFRKKEPVIPANNTSFSFVSGENFGVRDKRPGGQKPHIVTGEDGSTDPFLNFKSHPKNDESKEIEKENRNEKRAVVWDGPLCRYTTYTGKKTPEECMDAIGESLGQLEQEKLVDWEIEDYSVFGRMYHALEMSEFMIHVYTSSDNEHKSVIEVRRSSGDTFVHDEFFCRVSKFLKEQSILEYKEDECEVDFGLSLALEPLSLDSLAHMETLNTDFLKELTSSKDGMSDDETNLSESTDTTLSTQQLGDELIDIVTNRESYQEVFRHSSGILCQELQTNPQLLQYVITQNDIIERLMKPLTEDFYDTLIIRNILQVVKQLLQHENPKVAVHANCAKEIRELKKIWTSSVQHNYIDMKFGKSQQVERLCRECLELLQKRF